MARSLSFAIRALRFWIDCAYKYTMTWMFLFSLPVMVVWLGGLKFLVIVLPVLVFRYLRFRLVRAGLARFPVVALVDLCSFLDKSTRFVDLGFVLNVCSQN